MSRVTCGSCGARVEIPAGHSRARIRCGDCGYYVDVPADLRGTPAPDEPPPVEAVKKKKKKKASTEPPPLLVGTQDEDDDRPYTVPGDPVKKCTACFKEIDIDASFCVHCGVDLTSGKKAKKTFETVDKFWEERYSRALRLKVFLGFQVFNLLLAVGHGSLIDGIAFLAVQGGLQAFLCGSYGTLSIKRTSKGKATLIRQFFICFYPGKTAEVDVKPHHGVGIVAHGQPDLADWVCFLYLFICTLIVPGLLFYWFVMRPDRFYVTFCDEYGSTNEVVFRTTDREVADEICKTIKDVAGLWYKPVM